MPFRMSWRPIDSSIETRVSCAPDEQDRSRRRATRSGLRPAARIVAGRFSRQLTGVASIHHLAVRPVCNGGLSSSVTLVTVGMPV
jgi:hypothetical protein